MSFRGIRFVPDGTRIDFVRQRFIAFAVTGILIAASLGSLALQGLNLGIDFSGGILIEVAADEPIDVAEMRRRIEPLQLGDVSLQHFGSPEQVLIGIGAQGSEEANAEALRAVRDVLGEELEYRRTEQVGPKVGAELLRDGIIATVLAVLAIGAYVYFRFEWQFAVSALVATAHDVLVTVGLYSVLQLEFSLTAVAAVLTLAGYSVNDTVVVFDRIRELLRRHKAVDMKWIINLSVNQTLSRTVMTSVTTLLAVVPLLLFGGSALFSFSLAIFWGIIIGTYSSVFVAGSLLLYMPPLQGNRAPAAEGEARRETAP